MPDHLKLTCGLGALRVVFGVGVAAWLVRRGLQPSVIAATGGTDADRVLILGVGAALLTLVGLRVLLLIGAACAWQWTRRVGIAMAAFDCCNLLFFPLSTAFGLQALVGYRHPETHRYFVARGGRGPDAS